MALSPDYAARSEHRDEDEDEDEDEKIQQHAVPQRLGPQSYADPLVTD